MSEKYQNSFYFAKAIKTKNDCYGATTAGLH